MKYQCTKCGARRVATRPVKASCKDFEIDDAQTPKDPTARSVFRRFMGDGRKYRTVRLLKYHINCPPNYHKFDFVAMKQVTIKA